MPLDLVSSAQLRQHFCWCCSWSDRASNNQAVFFGIANAACASATRAVAAKLRPLVGPPRQKQKGPAPLPAVRREDGGYAQTPKEASARWLRHFSTIEQGDQWIRTQRLIQRCISRQADAELEDLEVMTHELPSRCEPEASMRSSKTDRAAGNDILPAELWTLQAATLSGSMYSLLLEIAFRLEEPLQLKGGTMHQIWKCKGPQDTCSSYRGILVSSAFGKCLHGLFRDKGSKWFEMATPLQVGGWKGFSVQLAAQAACSFQRAALGMSMLLRLSAFQIPPAEVASVHEYVRRSALIRDAGASPWAAAMLREFHTDTWFYTSSFATMAQGKCSRLVVRSIEPAAVEAGSPNGGPCQLPLLRAPQPVSHLAWLTKRHPWRRMCVPPR